MERNFATEEQKGCVEFIVGNGASGGVKKQDIRTQPDSHIHESPCSHVQHNNNEIMKPYNHNAMMLAVHTMGRAKPSRLLSLVPCAMRHEPSRMHQASSMAKKQ